jgi:NADH-quinone oxidoreductase subunit E
LRGNEPVNNREARMSTETELGYLFDWVEGVQGKVRELVGQWKDREGNLIMILHAIQNEFGYVPRGVANELSKELGISLARIYEVITFYHYFRLVPPGKHTVQVCTGTACYLKGSSDLIEELETRLGVKEGEAPPDSEYHLETVRCIGCCGMAPAIVIDGDTFGRLCRKDVNGILERQRKGKRV